MEEKISKRKDTQFLIHHHHPLVPVVDINSLTSYLVLEEKYLCI